MTRDEWDKSGLSKELAGQMNGALGEALRTLERAMCQDARPLTSGATQLDYAQIHGLAVGYGQCIADLRRLAAPAEKPNSDPLVAQFLPEESDK